MLIKELAFTCLKQIHRDSFTQTNRNETAEQSTQHTQEANCDSLSSSSSSQWHDLNIICKKCLKEINFHNILSHDKRCCCKSSQCSKCSANIDLISLERHNLIECKYGDYNRRVEINCPICLENLIEIPELHRKIMPCGHFICFKCAKQSVIIRRQKIKEIIANYTYYHEVSIAENKCPRCRMIFEMNELRTLYL